MWEGSREREEEEEEDHRHRYMEKRKRKNVNKKLISIYLTIRRLIKRTMRL